MDAAKLNNILFDLKTITERNINDLLISLRTSLNSGPNEVNKLLELIKSDYNRSRINNYSPSNLKILEKIGGTIYYGNTGFANLTDILSRNPYDIQKMMEDLQKYIDGRIAFVELVSSCEISLTKLNVSAHFYDDVFEIGLLFPKEVTENKIVNLTKELNMWDKVFKSIKELEGASSPEDTEISFINNGSLEFFITSHAEVAITIGFVIEKVVTIYKNIIEIRVHKERLKELGISVSEQRSVDKQEKDVLKNGIDEIAADLITKFASKSIDEGRINELKVAFKGHVTYIAKCIDKGMIIEITPPEITPPDPAPENSTDDKKAEAKALQDKYKLTLDKVNIVEKSMSIIKTLGKAGGDILKYLNEGEDNKD